MISVSIGMGKNDDARRAGADAVTQALATLPDKHAQCVVVFGSALIDQDALMSGIADAAPGVQMAGCSTAGEISSEGLASEGSVVIVAINSDQLHMGTGFGTHMEWNARRSGIDLAHTIQDAMETKMTSGIIFANVLSGGVEDALFGLYEQVGGPLVTLTGGAADNFTFYETSQYHDGRAFSDAVTGVGFGGTYSAASVMQHGFLPVGVLRHVTKSSGNIIEEIDGAPAIQLYEDYFGEQYSTMLQQGKLSAFASSYPLGIYAEGREQLFLRSPLRVDVEKGVIVCGGRVPQGSNLRLMISDKQQAVTIARNAARELMRKLAGKKPKVVFMFSSSARRKLLGHSADREVRAVQEEIGREVPLAGFYSYAECAQDGNIGDAMVMHNGAVALFAITE